MQNLLLWVLIITTAIAVNITLLTKVASCNDDIEPQTTTSGSDPEEGNGEDDDLDDTWEEE